MVHEEYRLANKWLRGQLRGTSLGNSMSDRKSLVLDLHVYFQWASFLQDERLVDIQAEPPIVSETWSIVIEAAEDLRDYLREHNAD